MPLLYYWRGDNHRRDLDLGAGFHLNQSSPVMHQIDVGDSLWAFTRRSDGVYVLAAELVVSAKTLNSKGYRYGSYRLWGHLKESRYFQTEGQPDLTTLVRGLSVRAGGDVLGRAFQGRAAVRPITEQDHMKLIQHAWSIPLEPRARLIPEERLEALIYSGDEAAVSALLREEPAGMARERREYLMSEVVRRDRELLLELRDLYDGSCQTCGWAPRSIYATDLCEGHHVRWISRGGDPGLNNMVLLCPNHHRAVHRLDAPFDWGQQAFLMSGDVMRLERVRHELGEGR